MWQFKAHTNGLATSRKMLCSFFQLSKGIAIIGSSKHRAVCLSSTMQVPDSSAVEVNNWVKESGSVQKRRVEMSVMSNSLKASSSTQCQGIVKGGTNNHVLSSLFG